MTTLEALCDHWQHKPYVVQMLWTNQSKIYSHWCQLKQNLCDFKLSSIISLKSNHWKTNTHAQQSMQILNHTFWHLAIQYCSFYKLCKSTNHPQSILISNYLKIQRNHRIKICCPWYSYNIVDFQQPFFLHISHFFTTS